MSWQALVLALLAVLSEAVQRYMMALSVMCAVTGTESAADNPDHLPASILQCWGLIGAGFFHVLLRGSLAVW